jgi:hypothetical protein
MEHISFWFILNVSIHLAETKYHEGRMEWINKQREMKMCIDR